MKKLLTLACALLITGILGANNIKITNGPVILRDKLAQEVLKVRFDLSWDNSWNLPDPGNWDAAWVFMKYRVTAGSWRHAILRPSSEHTIGNTSNPIPSEIMVKEGTSLINGAKKNMGVFLYRRLQGSFGTTSLKDVTLHWDVAGLRFSDSSVISVHVFAIEMVYIPDGSFVVGDGISKNRLMKYGNMLSAFNNPEVDKESEYVIHKSIGTTRRNSIIPVMTGQNTPSGVASTNSTTSGSRQAWNAFDNDRTTRFQTPNLLNWAWLQYQFPKNNGRKATWMLLLTSNSASESDLNFAIRGFKVEGSNDGLNFTTVHGGSGFIDPDDNPTGSKMFIKNHFVPVVFDNPGNYEYYRFSFYGYTKAIYEIKLFDDDPKDVNRIENETRLDLVDFTAETEAKPGIVKATYPKGTKAFYVTKHEVTQGAYVDYLNTLSLEQQTRLTPVAPTAQKGTLLYPNSRNVIRVEKPAFTRSAAYGLSVNGSNYAQDTNAGNNPVFGLSWTEVSAYLDWAALRPLSELEYEKAARGTLKSRYYEYAWGDFVPAKPAIDVKNANLANEIPLPLEANYAAPDSAATTYSATINKYWPVRAGSFAKKRSQRESTGSTYWGVLNFTDNIAELVVNLSEEAGRNFTGEHGDGRLPETGLHDVPYWPAPEATTLSGLGYRGIAVYPDAGKFKISKINTVSDRRYVDNYHGGRDPWTGIRGGRTAE